MTISESEADAFVGRGTPVNREAAQRVLDYLIFHRAMLDDAPDRPPILDRYLSLVENLKEGVHIIIPDPYQKATALLFELVMEEEFDPWEIDLVRFTQTYLERVRSEGGIDFAVAGRLLYMAWSILYLQSREVLETRENPAPSPDDGLLDLPQEDDGYLGDLTTPEAVDVTSTILGAPTEPVLTPIVQHPETRPVSLLELVQAFGQAEQDAKRSLQIQELRERLREEQRAVPEVLVHGDIPERDLQETWEVALAHPIDERFKFLDLWRRPEGRDRLVAIFLATLFLARENVLRLEQESLGESDVYLVRLSAERHPVVEE